MVFNAESIKTEPITVDKKYPGLRFFVTARMKDFFDCYQLLTQRNLDDDLLYEAIVATFDNRALAYKPHLKLFTDEFAIDTERLMRWKSFLKKIQWKEDIPFSTVMDVIKGRLQPLAVRYWGNNQ